ncbi:MAG: hypothetical protein HZB67_03035 [Candidatus Aenigmarchaeota archaeon]|nr:hypothetical protein [Candidatus Aenigmarchaeota archaeon]
MFGGKKKEMDRPVPLDRVRAMSRTGMSDRDIIKQLKSEGYSYNEIEKAMLQSVKEGVSNEPFSQPMTQGGGGAEVPRQLSLPVFEEEQGDREAQDILNEIRPEGLEGEVSPDVVMEELIEEIVQEKVAKTNERVKQLENTIAMLKAEIKHSEDIIVNAPSEHGMPKEFEDKVEELEARVGGLEKAFKQFLPSLTKNIEELADMIHEMKERRVEAI